MVCKGVSVTQSTLKMLQQMGHGSEECLKKGVDLDAPPLGAPQLNYSPKQSPSMDEQLHKIMGMVPGVKQQFEPKG
jgi:hypothetical protein